MTKKSNDLNTWTQKELLIRMDERQKIILSDINEVKVTMASNINRIERLEVKWAKAVGYGAGAGAVAGIVIQLINRFI